MIRRPPRSTQSRSSAASDVYKRQEIDPTAQLVFIINAASGRNDPDTTRQVIEEALKANGRTGELRFTRPVELARAAQLAAATACARRSAVVAVGGDGTINSVAQAAHLQGCV